MSTGPKTEGGKRKASQNSYKHGLRSAEIRWLESLLAEQKQIEREIRNLDSRDFL